MTLSEIESFFKNYQFKENSYRLSRYEVIDEPKLFVESHLKAIKTYRNINIITHYKNRLERFIEVLKQ